MGWQGRVQLFNNVPFDLKNNHTRWFDHKTQQENYFAGLNPVKTMTDMRHTRIENGYFDVENYADSIDYVNYAIIKNYTIGTTNTSVRDYYVFITKVEYINARVTRLHFEVDVLQTYQFDLIFKQSFVERQHLNSANNTIEHIDLGEDYLHISTQIQDQLIDRYFDTMVITTTSPLADGTTKYYPTITSGVATPLFYYLILVPRETKNNLVTIYFNGKKIQHHDYQDHLFILKAFGKEEHANKIVSISYLPLFPYPATVSRQVDGNNINYTITSMNNPNNKPYLLIHSKLFDTDTYVISIPDDDTIPHSFSNYIDVDVQNILETYLENNGLSDPKLWYYPFARAVLRDNLGQQLEFKPQYLQNGKLKAELMTSISSNPQVAYRATTYKTGVGMTNALISNVNVDVEVINDYTATYIQGNKNQTKHNAFTGALGASLQMAGGLGIALAGAGNPLTTVAGLTTIVGGGVNAFNSIYGKLAKETDINRVPPSLQSQAGADNLILGYGYTHPQVDIEMIDLEYLKRADNFLKHYGYSVKDVMDLNLKTRTHFNFIKTIGCNVVGTVPQQHLDKVRNIFDSGVTLWHTNDIYNYKVNNEVRS